MAGPRRDTRGIVEARKLFARVDFRRREPAPELRACIEHYWLIDWDLTEPHASHVVPHPSVNLVFQQYGDTEPWAEIAGIGLGLFAQKLAGRGRVCGVQFRPGGFRPFAPHRPVSDWTGRRVPLTQAYADLGPVRGAADEPGGSGRPVAAGTSRVAAEVRRIVGPDDEDTRVAALDTFLLDLAPAPDPQASQAMALVDRIRADRSIRRVAELAAAEGVSTRSVQRLFSAYVGVGPKWVILRYRIHEALERAETDTAALDWSALAAELGYSDQAHLVRDFTATVGVPPTAYARPPH